MWRWVQEDNAGRDAEQVLDALYHDLLRELTLSSSSRSLCSKVTPVWHLMSRESISRLMFDACKLQLSPSLAIRSKPRVKRYRIGNSSSSYTSSSTPDIPRDMKSSTTVSSDGTSNTSYMKWLAYHINIHNYAVLLSHILYPSGRPASCRSGSKSYSACIHGSSYLLTAGNKQTTVEGIVTQIFDEHNQPDNQNTDIRALVFLLTNEYFDSLLHAVEPDSFLEEANMLARTFCMNDRNVRLDADNAFEIWLQALEQDPGIIEEPPVVLVDLSEMLVVFADIIVRDKSFGHSLHIDILRSLDSWVVSEKLILLQKILLYNEKYQIPINVTTVKTSSGDIVPRPLSIRNRSSISMSDHVSSNSLGETATVAENNESVINSNETTLQSNEPQIDLTPIIIKDK